MTQWNLSPAFSFLSAEFGTLDAVFSCKGERVAHSPVSEMLRVEINGTGYYIKRYRRADKMRRWLRHWRLRSEWRNMRNFSDWGLSTPQIVAYGEERRFGLFRRGALVTLEIPDAVDLAALAKNEDARLRDAGWLKGISEQVSRATRSMHERHFVHNDLKWRNLLVNEAAQIFFIDCPSGGFWFGPPFHQRVIKDLACLDKVAKQHLSRSQRLRFYLQYVQRKQLNKADKRRIGKVLSYFKGRE